MDALGPTSFRKDYRILRPGGRLIMYGASELQTGETRNLAWIATVWRKCSRVAGAASNRNASRRRAATGRRRNRLPRR